MIKVITCIIAEEQIKDLINAKKKKNLHG